MTPQPDALAYSRVHFHEPRQRGYTRLNTRTNVIEHASISCHSPVELLRLLNDWNRRGNGDWVYYVTLQQREDSRDA
jgi:hypothetical protein